jgi:hypothetical protein
MERTKKDNNYNAEYLFEKYKFTIENKFADNGRKIKDILIELVTYDLSKELDKSINI